MKTILNWQQVLFFIVFAFVLITGCSPPVEALPSEESTSQTRAADGMVMVYVPAGTFHMGSPLSERSSPTHRVTLDAFWIDQTEVTNTMFADFLNEMGNQNEDGVDWWEPGAGSRGVVYGHIDEDEGVFSPEPGYENHPMVEISWYGAAAYCEWAGGRLPTEAEWEYAARGPEALLYPWGNEFDGTLVNYCDTNCTYDWKDAAYDDGYPEWAPVGSYPDGASWCGAYDMAGNIWEWVQDWWTENYSTPTPLEDPMDPQTGTLYVVRGASWFDDRSAMQVFTRTGLTPSSYRMHWVGFRCVSSEP
ncbi:MAG: formylglycine-generating enzyme family protein [Anaerolineae bacterium]|jgi:serine/threonine-protein kinase|nr:formylglycine-generating enzyme family protein [Anaerolineae bacterium]